ncbi:hypothetical protein Pla163_03380 [Planctomycetes bacterium Pla163]|uniref:Uncharacterized protein n=1 Tax=Rohdeia mirabilis TaxID=2528008 RepID=A0A518CVJ5_9BACT|nr:hypothetical protein Pla163_03380 [Planctomycetes bacterium Pla163]
MKLRVLAFAAVLALLGVIVFVLTRPGGDLESLAAGDAGAAEDESVLESVELADDATLDDAPDSVEIADIEPLSDRAALATDGPWSDWIAPLDHTGAPIASFEVAVVARGGSRTTHASDDALVRDLVPAGGVLVVVADGHCPRFVDVDRLRELGEGPHELPLAPSATVRLTANTDSPWYRDVLFVQVGASERRETTPANRLVHERFRAEAGVILPAEFREQAMATMRPDEDEYSRFALDLQGLARGDASAEAHAHILARLRGSQHFGPATAPIGVDASRAGSLERRATAPHHQVWSIRRAVDPIELPLEMEWVLAGDVVVVDAASAGAMRMTGPDGAFDRAAGSGFDSARRVESRVTLEPGDVAHFEVDFTPYAEIRGQVPAEAQDVLISIAAEKRATTGEVQGSSRFSFSNPSETGAFTTGPITPGFFVVDVKWTAADAEQVYVRRAVDLTEGGVHDMGLVDGEGGPTLVIEPRFFDPSTGRDWTAEDVQGAELRIVLDLGQSGLKASNKTIGLRVQEDPTRPLEVRGLPSGDLTVRVVGVGARDSAFVSDQVDALEVTLTGEVHVPIDIPLRRIGTAHFVVASPVPVGERAHLPHAFSSRPDGSNLRVVPLEHVPGTDTFEGEISRGAGPLRIDAIWTDTLVVDGEDDVHRSWTATTTIDVRAGESNRFDLRLAESARALLPAHVLPPTPRKRGRAAETPVQVRLFLADSPDGIRLGECTGWIDGRPHVHGLLPNRPYRFRSERDVWIEFVTGGPGSLVTVDE